MRLCFYVIPSFLPSLPAGCRHADPKVKLLPAQSQRVLLPAPIERLPRPELRLKGHPCYGSGSNPAVALPPGRFLKRCDHRDRSHFISTVSPPPHSASHFRARVCALILSLESNRSHAMRGATRSFWARSIRSLCVLCAPRAYG